MFLLAPTVGRPGVVLVGEGSPNRLASLLAAEKKRVARVAYEVPITEFQVGNEEGQIPISKLQRKIMRLPRLAFNVACSAGSPQRVFGLGILGCLMFFGIGPLGACSDGCRAFSRWLRSLTAAGLRLRGSRMTLRCSLLSGIWPSSVPTWNSKIGTS